MRLLIQGTERITGAVDSIEHLSLIYKNAMYHALQEGLTNGIRHGDSTVFNFSLIDDGSALQFRLTDNGTGSDNMVMGFGLRTMRDRVEQLQGTLYIDSEPNKGCLLQIHLPY